MIFSYLSSTHGPERKIAVALFRVLWTISQF